jgi:GNAT superfamily N-acetyltransferase
MSPTPTVRAARPEDAEAFAACHLACWREAYEELWGAERFDEFDVHFLGELDGEVIGIAIAGPSRDADGPPTEQELYGIYVRAAHQGTGLADDLLDATLGDRPASLWVYRDNPRASAFYVHHDFIPDGDERTDSVGILEIRMVRH